MVILVSPGQAMVSGLKAGVNYLEEIPGGLLYLPVVDRPL